MKVAAVSRLKASLSEYLAGVKAGQEVMVTERGRPVAKLVPISEPQNSEEERLQEMERQGLVRMGRAKLTKDFWKLPRPRDPRSRVREALMAERREGR